MEFKILEVEELSQTLFAGFIRRQIVTGEGRRDSGWSRRTRLWMIGQKRIMIH